ncbi:ATP-binding protein [Paludisphaera borealis]|uniref:histidine kinase n=1 Tax=Paludisphaera borealis TaxID=1387353 RepID=A0A1U7CVR8_9BACT|nr:ATP-binding protein [Paludisphaera borealis]APW62996.1 Autoinducer 2 sensor kinase/phosphatase LuxQ [Paludisphaera borealis]
MSHSEDLLSAWVETVEDYAIILLDTAGNIASWNYGAERLLRHTEAEVLGKPSKIIYTEEDVANGVPEQELNTALATGRARDERWHVRKDRTRFWGFGFLSVLRAEDGTPRGFVKAFRDLTERKRMEDELRRQAEDLRDVDRRRNEFLAMLSHELRNPLSPILNSVYILNNRFGSHDPMIMTTCKTIERQVMSLKRMIDDLLDVSRIAKQKLVLDKRPVALGEILRHAVDDVRPLATERHQELTLRMDATADVLLEADPVRLVQVFVNLLTNAAKFTESGGKIWLTSRLEAAEVVVEVRDSGVGIAPDMLARVFELFTQADHSLSRRQGGLGIGLALVRNLVELHGGLVEVHSDGPGKGSVFVVRLPVLPKKVEAEAVADGDTGAPDAPSRRILIVEDNVDSARSLGLLLELSGHETFVAHDGPTALEMARELRPDVVMLDIGLPGMSGYEVAEVLNRESDALLIAMTGYAEDEKARQAGFQHYLVKPIDRDDLLALLGDGPTAPR